jgi:ATP synthase protein I
MLLGALRPCAAVLAVCLVAAGLLAGAPGVLGVVVAGLVVLLVLGLAAVAMVVTADVPPAAALGVAFLTYLLSVVAVGALLVGVADGPALSRPAFAVATVAASAAWLAGMAGAHRRWVRQGDPPDFPAALRGGPGEGPPDVPRDGQRDEPV